MMAFFKKIDIFNLFNIFMIIFCIASLFLNYIGCNVLNSQKLDCKINNDNFSYLSKGNEIIVTKNDNLVGKIRFKNHMSFKSPSKYLNLRCNAVALAGKIVFAGISAAAVGGGSVGAAILAELQATMAALGFGEAAVSTATVAAANVATTGGTLAGINTALAAGGVTVATDTALAAGAAVAADAALVGTGTAVAADAATVASAATIEAVMATGGPLMVISSIIVPVIAGVAGLA